MVAKYRDLKNNQQDLDIIKIKIQELNLNSEVFLNSIKNLIKFD